MTTKINQLIWINIILVVVNIGFILRFAYQDWRVQQQINRLEEVSEQDGRFTYCDGILLLSIARDDPTIRAVDCDDNTKFYRFVQSKVE